MKIGNKTLGADAPCFIIAEIAQNHDQKKEQAIELIRIAARTGADAVKVQTFSGLDIASAGQPSTDYDFAPAHRFVRWYEFLDSVMLPFEWYPELIMLTHELGMAFIGTPCSTERAQYLVEVGADALKIASMDNNNIPFLKDVGQLDRPIILSSGMADVNEIALALGTLGYPEREGLALLHCVSNYPTKLCEMNLRAITQLQSTYELPIGFSDHALTNVGAFGAVALGACIIEKHFTVNRALPGPDHFFSLEPEELYQLVKGIRELEEALAGGGVRSDTPSRRKMYRSIRAAVDLPRGTVITKEKLEIKRPADGLEPKHLDDIVGGTLARDVAAYEPITWEDLV